jgi:hypothetical protein
MVINLLCSSFDNALVSTSAPMSSMKQYLKVTFAILNSFSNKVMLHINVLCSSMFGGILCQWYCTWLSHQITITFYFIYPNSDRNFVIHMVSLVACVLAMYLASVVDKDIMASPPIMNTNLVFDLLSSRALVQSASQYSTKSWGNNLLLETWKQASMKWNNCIN